MPSRFLVTAAARSMEVLLLTAGNIGGVGIALNASLRLGVEIEVLEAGVSLGQLPVAVLATGLAGVCFAYANYAPGRWERRYAGPRLVAPLRRVPGGDRMIDGG